MKKHREKIVLRQLLLVGLGILIFSQGDLLSADPKKAEKPKQPKSAALAKTAKLVITLDTSKTPKMTEWAAKAKTECEKFYPTIVSLLGTPNAQQPLSVTISFDKSAGVAATSGTHITCNADYFTEHPDDYGAVIHELCHVVQAYGNQRVPSWVSEGIADYIRWFKYEPPARRPRVDPEHANYNDGYQTTAAFFDWIVRKKNKSFIQRMNESIRKGKYSDNLFWRYGKKPVDLLWQEFVKSLEKK